MDKVWKEIADKYVAEQGGALLNENVSHAPDFDIPLFKKRKSRRRLVFTCSAAAAALLVVFAVWRFMPLTAPHGMVGIAEPAPAAEAEPAAKAEPAAEAEPVPEAEAAADAEPAPATDAAPEPTNPPLEIVQLSAKLPAGSRVLDTKYDNGETVYTIENAMNNTIVISVKPPETRRETDGFIPVDINGADGYMLIKRDYKMLTVQSGSLLYTLTSAYEAQDLYDLAMVLI